MNLYESTSDLIDFIQLTRDNQTETDIFVSLAMLITSEEDQCYWCPIQCNNHNLNWPVSPNSGVKQPGVVHGPLLVQEKVELVPFDPEGDE